MSQDTRTNLILPATPTTLPIARAYVREIATLACFVPDDVTTLVEAGGEVCASIVGRTEGESTFSIAATIAAGTLTLAFRDHGVPFDPDGSFPGEDRFEREALTLAADLETRAVDHAQWASLGELGMELRLTKFRPAADITEQLSESELTPYTEEVPRAPEQEYAIRRMEPHEAVGVSQAIFRTYGYTYPNPDLYYPDRIIQQNADGELISSVAIDQAGEVAAHYTLERPGLLPIAESGQAVVNPAHRDRRLMQRMRNFLEDEGRRVGLLGIFSQPVTVHPFSQKVNESFGSTPCGVSLAMTPSETHFKGIEGGSSPQRVSLMLYFKHLVPPRSAIVYPPPHHQEILGRIYEKLGVPHDFRRPRGENRVVMEQIYEKLGLRRKQRRNVMAEVYAKLGSAAKPELPKLADGEGEMSVQFFRGFGAAFIQIKRIGADTPADLRRARRDLTDEVGAPVIYLDLPLAQPQTPALCAIVESEGFFFCALGRYFAADGTDTLRLQCPNVDLDLSKLVIANPFGQELRDYIAADRDRVRGAATVVRA